MEKVKIYKVRLYDIVTDEFKVSRRMATKKGATRMRGEVIEDTAQEIDATRLEPGEEWTPKDFKP